MSKKKGASMALTLVIVGVVLIMTAITVITFSSGSLARFFGFGQQNLQVSECRRLISEWCQQSEQQTGLEYTLANAAGEYTDTSGGTSTDGDPTCTTDASDENNATKDPATTRNDCRADWTESDQEFRTGNYVCKDNQNAVDFDGRCPVG